mmetsp:Transcript_16792/g.43633  ORF Transcript_16792/g.43633 Transcript_16792/m.43633 type:complete len:206 (-) Transcript_16792:2132-2749(-)
MHRNPSPECRLPFADQRFVASNPLPRQWRRLAQAHEEPLCDHERLPCAPARSPFCRCAHGSHLKPTHLLLQPAAYQTPARDAAFPRGWSVTSATAWLHLPPLPLRSRPRGLQRSAARAGAWLPPQRQPGQPATSVALLRPQHAHHVQCPHEVETLLPRPQRASRPGLGPRAPQPARDPPRFLPLVPLWRGPPPLPGSCAPRPTSM